MGDESVPELFYMHQDILNRRSPQLEYKPLEGGELILFTTFFPGPIICITENTCWLTEVFSAGVGEPTVLFIKISGCPEDEKAGEEMGFRE